MPAGGTNIGRLFVELGLKDADFRGGLKAAESSLQGLSASGVKFGRMFDRAVAGGFLAATTAAAGFAAASVTVGAGFEQAITTVGAISGAGDAISDLEAKARQLGAATAFSATEAATAMQDFARAGMTTNEIIAASEPALLLAGSAGASMSQSTALMAATLAQFNLDASESNRISDVFSTALRKSLFDMSSLTEAMKYAGTVGASFGMSLEQTTAAVAMFRDLGLEGSMAGTNLRMALAAAAKPTDNARKALKRYGLEAEDINPELHSFAEIMQTIGDAGLQTADALQIFGTRAGANVSMIARSFADGSTGFHELLDNLEDSAGSTESLYAEMMSTVAAQAKIVMSATEELLLSTFDTFREPLQELLTETAETIAYVAAVFKSESAGIGRGFDETIGDAVRYLRDNRAEMALAFVDTVRAVQQIVSELSAMLPTLRIVAQAMLALWAADKARQLSLIIAGLPAKLAVLRGSVHATVAALTAATGGTFALVAAVGAAVATMIAFAASMRSAEMAAEKLRAAEQKIADERATRDAQTLAAAQSISAGLAERVGAVELLLQSEGKLTDELSLQLSTLANLTDEQIAAGLASGKLYEATLAGNRVVLDAATALRLRYEATSLAEEVESSFAAAQRKSRAEQEKVAAQTLVLNTAMAEYQKAVGRGLSRVAAFDGSLRKHGDSLAEIKSRISDYGAQLDALKAQEQGLSQQRKIATQDLTKSEIAAENAIEGTSSAYAKAQAAAKLREQAEKKLHGAHNQRLAAVAAVEREIELIGKTGAERRDIQLQREIDDLNAKFAAEVQAADIAGADLMQIEQQRLDAIQLLRDRAWLEQRQTDTESAKKTAETVDDQVAGLRQSAAKRNASALEAIELDRLAALADAEGATVDQLISINEHYADQAAETRADLSGRVAALVGAESGEVVGLTRERDALLAELGEDQHAERLAVSEHYDEKIREATRRANKQAREDSREIVDQIKQIAKAALAAGRAVGDGLSSVVSSFGDLLSNLTGFSFDIFDAVGSISDDLQSAQDLADQLAAGDISPDEYAERMAELPASAADGAEQFIAELIDGAVRLVQTFVDAAPVLIQQLASKLPELIDTVIAALPDVLDAILAELPALVDMLSAAVVDLVQMLADELPQLLDAVIAELPKLIDAVAAALPILLDAVADGIAQILDALPDILDQLLSYLPDLIGALVDALDTIIIAVVDAIPRLIQSLIDALPDILMALLNGVLSLIGTIITRVIGELLPALIGMLPDLVTMLLGVVTQLVNELVAQLPLLIEGLLIAMTQVTSALMAMVPELITSIVEMLPALTKSLHDLIPALIEGVINAIPNIITAIVGSIPDITKAMTIELTAAVIKSIPDLIWASVSWIGTLVKFLWDEVFKGIGEFVAKIWEKLSGWIGDLFGKDESDAGESWWDDRTDGTFWSDTPSMQKTGTGGDMVGLAGGDYYVAAQDPAELLRQAIEGVGLNPGRVSVPGPQSASIAMLQAADAIREALAGGLSGAETGGLSMRATLRADGRTLDEVMWRAGRRGQAPHAERRARKATIQAGVHPGFDRGKFTK